MSFKVAPGVRMSASSRGIRTSIGGSPGRLSFGAGGTYASAAIGGVRVSQRIGGGSFYGSSPVRSTAQRANLTQLEQAETLQAQLNALEEIERRLVTLHQENFPAAAQREVLAPISTDVAQLSALWQKQIVKKISIFKRQARRDARAHAHELAAKEAARLDEENAERYGELLAQAADDWHRLTGHDRVAVMEALETAFADNDSEAFCVDADTDERGRFATIVVCFGTASMVPERTTGRTPTGRLSAKKRTKTDRNAVYVQALGSTVLATVKEAFAVAPSVERIDLLVLRRDPEAARPADFITPIYAAEFERSRVKQLRWRSLDPGVELLTATSARFQRKGAAGDVAPIDLSDFDHFGALLDQVEAALREAR